MILLDKLNTFENTSLELKNELKSLKQNFSNEAINTLLTAIFETAKEGFLKELEKQNSKALTQSTEALKSENKEQITKLFLEQIKAELSTFNTNPLFEREAKKSLESFFNTHKSNILAFIKQNANFDDFKEQKEAAINEFYTSITALKEQLLQEIEGLKSIDKEEFLTGAISSFLNENKTNLYKNLDLSFLVREFSTNDELKNTLLNTIRVSISQMLRYKDLKAFLEELMKEKAKELFKDALNNDELLNLRFLTLLNLSSLNLNAELAMISSNLEYLNMLRAAELRALGQTKIFNKTYDVV